VGQISYKPLYLCVCVACMLRFIIGISCCCCYCFCCFCCLGESSTRCPHCMQYSVYKYTCVCACECACVCMCVCVGVGKIKACIKNNGNNNNNSKSSLPFNRFSFVRSAIFGRCHCTFLLLFLSVVC